MHRLLSGREAAVWAACFAAVAVLLVLVGFTSDDPDSALYAALSDRLADEPVRRWIAPEWWGQWDSEGLFREHPAGVFLVPTLLGAAGVPGIQATYIVGIATGLLCVLLIAHLTAGVTSRADGRAMLVLLQIMPLASIFRIRANHEYPMLLCLLLALVGADAVRRSWTWAWLTPVALTAAMLVKGVFAIFPVVAVACWILTNPRQRAGSAWRPVAACLLGFVVMALVAVVYDAAYLRVTGETFWGPYWARQLAPLTLATPVDGADTLLHHVGFYLLRILWHPAPWSLTLSVVLWRCRGRLAETWRQLAPGAARGLLFALGCAVIMVVLLVPASRFAERYIFSANYLLAAAGIVVTLHTWPAVRHAFEDADRRLPALGAWVWFGLMVVRLVVGPYLPRISG